jgi:predicted RNase H-like HicB family nuclease
MFSEYIQAALMRAEYDTLEDGSYVATVPGLQGVIATGNDLEECRKDLIEVIEEWIVARLQWGYPIPTIGGYSIMP